MKKVLLAGTSALALTLTAGVARADDTAGKFNVLINGDAFVEGAYITTKRDDSTAAGNSTGAASTQLLERFRLNIIPTATADNGLTYGARARIRANSGAAAIDGDRSYIFFKSPVAGEVWAGTSDSPSNQFYDSALSWDWNVLYNFDEWKRYLNTGSNLSGNANNPATTKSTADYAWSTWSPTAGLAGVFLPYGNTALNRVNYWTPRFAGFQGAVSFIPKTTSALTGVDRTTENTLATSATAGDKFATSFQDVYELDVNYTAEFNGLGIKATGGYEGAKATADSTYFPTNFHDLEAFNVGLKLTYANFQLAGNFLDLGKSGYAQLNNHAVHQIDQTAWTVGGQYTYGPAIFGVSYESEVDATPEVRTASSAPTRKLDTVTGGVTYNVAPGLQGALEYSHFTATNSTLNSAAAGNNSGDVVLVRSIVKF